MGMSSVRSDVARSSVPADRPSRRFDPTEVDSAPHGLERQVCRVLTSQPGLSISGLVVHRIRNGVCLTGVVESMPGGADVCGLAKQVSGVDEVVNRLLVRSANAG